MLKTSRKCENFKLKFQETKETTVCINVKPFMLNAPNRAQDHLIRNVYLYVTANSVNAGMVRFI